MKNKLLLAVAMIAVLVGVLAISVGAIEYNGLSYTLKDDGTAIVADNRNYEGDPTVVIPSTFVYEEKTYTVTETAGYLFNGNSVVETIYFPSTITKIGNYTFSQAPNLKSVYIDFENLTHVGECGMTNNSQPQGSNIKNWDILFYATSEYGKENPVATTHLDLQNVVSLGMAAFQGINVKSMVVGGNLTTINKQVFRKALFETVLVKGEIVEICDYAFEDCKNLTTFTMESTSLKKVGGSAFSACKVLESFTMEMSKCESVGYATFEFSSDRGKVSNTPQWYNAKGEKTVDLSSLKTISTRSFASSNIGGVEFDGDGNVVKRGTNKVILPVALNSAFTTSDSSAFRNCNIGGTVYINFEDGLTGKYIDTWALRGNCFETIIFGSNVTDIRGQTLNPTSGLKNVVFLADSVNFTDNVLNGCPSGVNFYYKNYTIADGKSLSSSRVDKPYTSATYTSYNPCGFVVAVTDNEGTTTFGKVVHSTNDAVDNTLCPVGKVVVTSCKYCDYLMFSVDGEAVEKKEHSYSLVGSISYVSYFEMGYKTTKCECGDEKANETATELALFESKGYSACEFGEGLSVTQGFYVNKAAIEAYKAYKPDFDFGIIATVNHAGTAYSPDLNSDDVINVKFDNMVNDYIDIKVTGIPSGNEQTAIVFCLFAKEGETVYYLDNGVCETTVVGKTYGAIIEEQEAKENA